MKSPNPRQGQKRAVATAPQRPRKGKVAGSLIAISSAAIVAIYTLGRTNTSAAYDQLTVEAPAAVVAQVPAATPTAIITASPVRTEPTGGGGPQPTSAPPTARAQSTPTSTANYKDGTYIGNGTSRHGGMQVTVVIKDGKIDSANVTSCTTRYPCSDIDPLIGLAISQQNVPANHVSGATDSSKAYRQALGGALQQAKA